MSKKVIRLFVLLPILIFVVLRIWQGFEYVEPYFKQVFQIILYKRTESYSERQFQTMGIRYLFPKKIADVTPENSIICYSEQTPEANPDVDAYFLYPRTVRIINRKDVLPPDQVRDLKCNYLVMNNSQPDFDIKVKKVFVFGQGLNDLPVVTTPGLYLHNDPIYQNKVGLLEL